MHLFMKFSATYYITEGSRTSSNLVQIKGQYGICPGDIAAYRCTVCGAGATLWSGSIFECTSGEILLRHAEFLNNRSASSIGGQCNKGAVVAQSIGVDVDTNSSHSVRECYSSHLNISMNMSMNITKRSCAPTILMVSIYLLLVHQLLFS